MKQQVDQNPVLLLPLATTKTRQEICNEYNISYKVFKRKLNFHGIKLPPGVITPKYQENIYLTFGLPPNIK
ncbi:MAG: hypothetical protein RLZZ292_4049 [Bacteroidota bacterium]|jgi:hypothetical protein